MFAQCVVDRAKEVAAANEKCPVKESLLPMLEGLEVKELDVETELRSRVERSVAKNEASMIGALREDISRWTALREEEVLQAFLSYTRPKSISITQLESLKYYQRRDRVLIHIYAVRGAGE